MAHENFIERCIAALDFIFDSGDYRAVEYIAEQLLSGLRSEQDMQHLMETAKPILRRVGV